MYVPKDRAQRTADLVQVRAAQGKKLRALYRSLGWSRDDARKFFHTSERTLRNWESGRNAIPYTALKLLRIRSYLELPGDAWRGWSISRGKLCTPEGHLLDPRDANWWSLLVRRAEVGGMALAQLGHLKSGRAGAWPGAKQRACERLATGQALACAAPQAPSGGEADARGLSLYKTSVKEPHSDGKNGINLIPFRYQPDTKEPCPSPSASPTTSAVTAASAAPGSGSASTPSSPSPWTNTCGGLVWPKLPPWQPLPPGPPPCPTLDPSARPDSAKPSAGSGESRTGCPPTGELERLADAVERTAAWLQTAGAADALKTRLNGLQSVSMAGVVPAYVERVLKRLEAAKGAA